jgi:hypothetical protein
MQPTLATICAAVPMKVMRQQVARVVFHADEKQQQQHADLADARQGVGLGQQRQAMRAEQHPGGQVAHHVRLAQRARDEGDAQDAQERGDDLQHEGVVMHKMPVFSQS